MRKLVLVLVVLVALFVMVGCKGEEPTPTVVIGEDVEAVLDVLENQDYLLALVIDRRETSGGYEYLIKLSNQETYDRDKWYFSKDYIITGYMGVFVQIDETHYYLANAMYRNN